MQKYFVEARQLLALAIPVILAQVAQTAMGFVDTVMEIMGLLEFPGANVV